MRTVSNGLVVLASFQGGKSAARFPINVRAGTIDGKSVADDEDWFAEAARVLLPNKAGTALHCTTGFDERMCQRYAAGDTKPPSYFFRKLLRSDGGWIWLSAAMDGCDAPWWREVNQAVRIAEAVKREL